MRGNDPRGRSRRRRVARVVALPLVVALTALTACGDDDSGGAAGSGGTERLQVMIGSSGEAETAAVQAAAERFTDDTGIDVEVVPAQDLNQQLTQGFAGGSPPDVFYADPTRVRQFRDELFAYGDQIDDLDDFEPSLVESYTVDDEVVCVPKDGGTLALVINNDAWAAAGLTEADYPQTWDDLTSVSQALTTGDQTGLAFVGTRDMVGAFMLQAGGWFVNEDNTEATADTPENSEALAYIQENIAGGNFEFTARIDTEWGGEALGTGKAAMTIEGPWIIGALDNDYPDVQWTAVPLPEGPDGPGTMQFSNCWGIAADSPNTEAAVDLVEHLVSPEEQQAFTEAFGPTPSRTSLQDWYEENQPEAAAFNGFAESRAPVPLPSFTSVLDDFNAQLEQLADGSASPEQILERVQTNAEAAIQDEG
jgi:multiple sugar transport system substrate-binding protein